MRALRRVTCALATALLVTGCIGSGGGNDRPRSTGSPSGPAPTTTPGAALARFYEQQPEWKDCSGGFECTQVTVPVDYADPDGATLELAVNRLPADDEDERIGSLLVNPGGPGASGLQYARSARAAVGDEVRDRYDVVGFDPRGVGASAGIQCLTDRQLDAFLAYDGTPDDDAEVAGLLGQGDLLARGCQQDDAELMAHMGTRDAARDLDVLRAVLGDERLNYLGKSYGTYLGATYAGLFPDRVGRLVLDGPIDPAASSLDVARLQALGFQRALEAFLDDCLGRDSCPLSGNSAQAQQQIADLLDRLDASPLPGDRRRRVTESLAVLGIAVALYDEGSWSFLRQALAQALDGNGEILLLLADFYSDRGPGGRYTTNANEAIYAVNCLDRPNDEGAEELAAEAEAIDDQALFGPYIIWSNLPCHGWPVPAQGTPEPVAAPGSQPILVVGTTRDPATPYEWAEALADQLEAGALLTYDGDGHTAYRRGSKCVDDAVDAYLLEGTVPGAGLRCR